MVQTLVEIEAPYRDLTLQLRKSVAREVQSGNYPHLRSPNTKGRSDVPVDAYKGRLNILVRPRGMEQTNERNLNVGNLELVLVVTGTFPEDTLDGGLRLKSTEDMRLIKGDNLLHPEYASAAFFLKFGRVSSDLKEMLFHADYDGFVQRAVATANSSMALFKKNYPIYERMG